jgi:cobalt-precorrin 5A hydrolase
MKAAVFSFTKKGTGLALKIYSYLQRHGWDVQVLTLQRFIQMDSRLLPMKDSLQRSTGEQFSTCRLLVFIGAAGIAVRSIAPFLRSKEQDPAVIVIDEKGQYIIPILSGHIGGANAAAAKLAAYLCGQAVLTTATDVNQLFAVDEWAHRHRLTISSMGAAKAFSAGLLETGHAGIYSDFPIEGPLPDGVEEAADGPLGMAVTLRRDCHPFAQTVVLQPRVLHLGIGCRKGISEEAIARLVSRELRRLHMDMGLVADVNSIDVKKEEPGLLGFAKQYGLPLQVYTAEQLQRVSGSSASSDFVRRTVGVDNVCERAALRACRNGGRLLVPKTVADGVTLAVACEHVVISFDRPE